MLGARQGQSIQPAPPGLWRDGAVQTAGEGAKSQPRRQYGYQMVGGNFHWIHQIHVMHWIHWIPWILWIIERIVSVKTGPFHFICFRSELLVEVTLEQTEQL